MKLRVPDYYKSFHCLADKCKDSCCIGWEIDIDEETLEYYEHVQGAFGKRLKENIVRDDEDVSFALHKGRCAFLNDKNLCDICIELGETSLCEICLEYPRFTVEYGTTREKCLGLSCEEAGRLIFEKESPVTFLESNMEEQFAWQEEEDEYEEGEEEMDDSQYPYLERARNYAISLLQDRECSIKERAEKCILFAEEVQEALNARDFTQIDVIIHTFEEGTERHEGIQEADKTERFIMFRKRMDVYGELELLDEEWAQVYKQMISLYQTEQDYEKIHETFSKAYQREAVDYEHLLVYFVFRYGMKAVYDYNFLEKIKFALVSYLVIRDMDAERFYREGKFTLEERIDVARIYSKEVEHSEDNLEMFSEACMFEEAFQWENILKCI